jgi:hypothetical protein
MMQIQVHDMGGQQTPPAAGRQRRSVVAQTQCDAVAKGQQNMKKQDNQQQPNPSAAIPL